MTAQTLAQEAWNIADEALRYCYQAEAALQAMYTARLDISRTDYAEAAEEAAKKAADLASQARAFALSSIKIDPTMPVHPRGSTSASLASHAAHVATTAHCDARAAANMAAFVAQCQNGR